MSPRYEAVTNNGNRDMGFNSADLGKNKYLNPDFAQVRFLPLFYFNKHNRPYCLLNSIQTHFSLSKFIDFP